MADVLEFPVEGNKWLLSCACGSQSYGLTLDGELICHDCGEVEIDVKVFLGSNENGL